MALNKDSSDIGATMVALLKSSGIETAIKAMHQLILVQPDQAIFKALLEFTMELLKSDRHKEAAELFHIISLAQVSVPLHTTISQLLANQNFKLAEELILLTTNCVPSTGTLDEFDCMAVAQNLVKQDCVHAITFLETSINSTVGTNSSLGLNVIGVVFTTALASTTSRFVCSNRSGWESSTSVRTVKVQN